MSDDAFVAFDNIDYNKLKQEIIDSFVNDNGDRDCEYCGESFMFVNRLLVHLREVHKIERPFKCPQCEKTYPQRFMLNAHVKKAHGDGYVVACAHCSFSTLDREKLERHIKRLHENDLPVSTGGGNQNQLKNNSLNYLQNGSPESSTPPVFLEPKKSRRGRPRSGRSIRPDRTYLCALCGKELKTCKGLEIHTRLHTGEKPFECQVCSKRFTCETMLRTHKNTHTGVKPYHCELCGKWFTQRSTLVVHKRYHSGERPYVCMKCDKGFVTRTLLNTHMRACQMHF